MGSIWQSHRSRICPTVARLTVASALPPSGGRPRWYALLRAGASEDHRTPTANRAFRVAPLLVDDRAGIPCFGQGPVRTTVPTVASRCFCVSPLPVDPGTVSHRAVQDHQPYRRHPVASVCLASGGKPGWIPCFGGGQSGPSSPHLIPLLLRCFAPGG